VLKPTDTLGDLVNYIKVGRRNIFPVVGDAGELLGLFSLNDVRELMFDRELYDKITMKDLMQPPEVVVNLSDSVEDIARKIQVSGRYNMPVLQNGKYVGFVSRANLFATYQQVMKKFSHA
jgi:CIC family chloride channel protein